MNVLILGSGGREHALAWKAAQSPRLKKLYAAPGSAAIAEIAACAAVDILDARAVAAFCAEKKIALVLIGPEAPLAAGVADGLAEAGIAVFGPGRAAARLESSKTFAKKFMDAHGIATAPWEAFGDSHEARAAVSERREPLVVKADGLAAGKGVRVCRGGKEALEAIAEFMDRRALGGAGRTVLIEDRLEGPEVSVMILCDGKNYLLLPSSRDHKRLRDGDQGPNTGGMGAFAPAELDAKTLAAVKTGVLDKILAGLASDGLDYRGVLYVGLMLTREGPQVLEFNCRFGDPETQAVLPLLRSDLLELASACVERRLDRVTVETSARACVCVTLASEGYPERPVTGKPIAGLDGFPKNSSDLMIFHAGTEKKGSEWLTSGGRVLGVTAVGPDVAAAREAAYAAAARIRFDGRQYRKDIGAQAPARI